MPIRINDPKSLEDWIVKTDQRLRDLEARRIDAKEGLEADPATKEMRARISGDSGNVASIGEDGGIYAEGGLTSVSADDHTPLIILKEMTAGQSINAGTDTLVSWGSEPKNTGFTSTATAITIPEAGDYLIQFQWQWANNAVGTRAIKVLNGGTGVAADVVNFSILSDTRPVVANVETAQGISATIDFAGGEVLRCFVFQGSGGALSGGGPYFGDIRGRWQISKVHDAFPPALTTE